MSLQPPEQQEWWLLECGHYGEAKNDKPRNTNSYLYCYTCPGGINPVQRRKVMQQTFTFIPEPELSEEQWQTIAAEVPSLTHNVETWVTYHESPKSVEFGWRCFRCDAANTGFSNQVDTNNDAMTHGFIASHVSTLKGKLNI